jgi:hypothetical protein
VEQHISFTDEMKSHFGGLVKIITAKCQSEGSRWKLLSAIEGQSEPKADIVRLGTLSEATARLAKTNSRAAPLQVKYYADWIDSVARLDDSVQASG